MTANSARKTATDALAAAAVRIFRPLVRILLRHNVSYKTCADWLRWCYADVAWKEFGVPGRKPTKSRVAILTGLTRIDVQQLLEMPPPDEIEQHERHHRAGLVLTGWASDARFHDGDAPIAVLPFESDDGVPSFSELVSRHSGGTPARAVLDELERNGAVEVLPGRHVRLKRTRYITQAADQDITYADIFGHSTGALVETIDHNWRPDVTDKRLQFLVYNREIHPELVASAQREIEDGARELAERIDQTLYDYEQRSDILQRDPDPPRQTVGLGLYFFEHPSKPSEPEK
ncbi:MAG: DUF6502 family protein [Wenzhouxiangellaceae bacterium]|nr:DUF6502 family protein [Wenzhouxiangellaceae bacterium]